jgi:hypothetical protein
MKIGSVSGFLGVCLACAAVFSGESLAAPMPQDSWSYYNKRLELPNTVQKKGIAVSADSVYVGITSTISSSRFKTTGIQKFTAAGAYVSAFSATFGDITGMACDSAGNLYVFDRDQSSLKSFDSAGVLRWSVGSAGNGDGQFTAATSTIPSSTLVNQHAHLTIDENDEVFVLDDGNNRVQVFDSQGAFKRKWGSLGTLAGQIKAAFGIAARNGQVVIVDTPSVRQRVQAFTSNGVFLRAFGSGAGADNFVIANERFCLSPDGLLTFCGSTSTYLFDLSLTQIGTLAGPPSFTGLSSNRLGAAFSPSGDLWSIGGSGVSGSSGSEVQCVERRYASTDNPLVRNVVPQPSVIKVAQRSASTLLDIDYKVVDPDSATADVAVLGFQNGGETLAQVLRIATLVENTSTHVGPGQATNTVKRLTWNAAADWSSTFGDIQIEVLAKDQRDLLGIHWITAPPSGAVASFSASAKPVEDADLLSLWFWLIAKGDPAISLVNGEVKGVGGAFNGQTLASGIATTAQGRPFLFGRLGVRAITTPELSVLQAGNYGFSSSSANTIVRP